MIARTLMIGWARGWVTTSYIMIFLLGVPAVLKELLVGEDLLPRRRVTEQNRDQ
jgi:hypothetical protein